MNDYRYATKEVIGVGVFAFLRTSRDGELKPILEKGGKPKVFSTRASALEDILNHLVRYVNGHLVRDGEIAGETRAKAEAAFNPIVRQKGKTKLITVAYKGQRQRCGARPGSKQQQQADQSDTQTEPSISPGFFG